MATNRIPREKETRVESTHRKMWERPELLPDPNPEPGYSFKWVRVSTLGATDPTNMSNNFRSGWVPVKADDHPEITVVVESDIGRYKDNIVIGGLILCKRPEEITKERSEYFQQQTKNQMRSVDNNLMRENDSRMPLFNDRKSEVTFGKGS